MNFILVGGLNQTAFPKLEESGWICTQQAKDASEFVKLKGLSLVEKVVVLPNGFRIGMKQSDQLKTILSRVPRNVMVCVLVGEVEEQEKVQELLLEWDGWLLVYETPKVTLKDLLGVLEEVPPEVKEPDRPEEEIYDSVERQEEIPVGDVGAIVSIYGVDRKTGTTFVAANLASVLSGKGVDVLLVNGLSRKIVNEKKVEENVPVRWSDNLKVIQQSEIDHRTWPSTSLVIVDGKCPAELSVCVSDGWDNCDADVVVRNKVSDFMGSQGVVKDDEVCIKMFSANLVDKAKWENKFVVELDEFSKRDEKEFDELASMVRKLVR